MRPTTPWLALLAPTFPVLVCSVTARVVTGWEDGWSWGIAPFSLLYGLWNMAASALAALGCARQALRWGRAGGDRRSVFVLAICGAWGLLPWSVIMSTTCLAVALGKAWTSQSPFHAWRDWVDAMIVGYVWPVWPTSRVFWILVAPGLALTALGLLLAARFVPARVRWRFFLLWCPVLALLVGVVCGMI